LVGLVSWTRGRRASTDCQGVRVSHMSFATVLGNANDPASEYGIRYPRLQRYLARAGQLLDRWRVSGLSESDMQDCRHVQHRLKSLLREWQANEPMSHRNKGRRQETRRAIKSLKAMQECGPGRTFSDWDRAITPAAVPSRASRGRREEHTEDHEEHSAEHSRSNKARRTTRPSKSSGRDTFRTTRGRSPETEQLRFDETASGLIYGESFFSWIWRNLKGERSY